jgi:hypothetical protein
VGNVVHKLFSPRRIGVVVEEGVRPPKFYGKAFYDYMDDEMVFYPIPFNFVVGFMRRAHARLVVGLEPDALSREYRKGCADGAEAQWVDDNDAHERQCANCEKFRVFSQSKWLV